MTWKEIAEPYLSAFGTEVDLDRAGVYAILLNGHIAYIGQSRQLRWRLASHLAAINDKRSKDYNQPKYKLFREAQEHGYQIQFQVLFFIPEEDLPLMDIVEAKEIDLHQPPLNIIHPAVNGHAGYKDNRVYTMDLPQFLSLLEGGNNDEL